MSHKLFIILFCLLVNIGLIVAVPVTDVKTIGHAIKNGHLSNKEQVVFEYNSTSDDFQEGLITEQWFTGGGSRWAETVVKIYIDGETSASLEYELFMGHGIGFKDEQYSPWLTKRIGKIANNGGLYNTYRIPFAKSIKITLAGPEDKENVFWYIVRGLVSKSVGGCPVFIDHLQLPPQARLHLYKNHNVTLKPLDYISLAKIDSGSGAVLQTTIAASSPATSKFFYLEACIRAFIDGGQTPVFLSSGTEDFFLSAFYFNTGVYHGEHAGLTHLDPKNSEFSAYKFFEADPLLFSSSFELKWRAWEDSNCPSAFVSKSEESDSIKVNSDATGDTYASSYTWIYTW